MVSRFVWLAVANFLGFCFADQANAGQCPIASEFASGSIQPGLFWADKFFLSHGKYSDDNNVPLLNLHGATFLVVMPSSDQGGMISIKQRIYAMASEQSQEVELHRSDYAHAGIYEDSDGPAFGPYNISGKTYQTYHSGPRTYNAILDNEFHASYRYDYKNKAWLRWSLNRHTNGDRERRKLFLFDNTQFRASSPKPTNSTDGITAPSVADEIARSQVRKFTSELYYYKPTDNKFDCIAFGSNLSSSDKQIKVDVTDIDRPNDFAFTQTFSIIAATKK